MEEEYELLRMKKTVSCLLNEKARKINERNIKKMMSLLMSE